MLRVRVEIVPYGMEDMAEEIAYLHIGNVGTHSSRRSAKYEVLLVEDGKQESIGTFHLHRCGWYRNRLGLAARALKMLQLRRDRNKFLPKKDPFGLSGPYERED